MTRNSFAQKSVDLLRGLQKNNSKEWFDAHRDEVKTMLQQPFEDMLEAATAQLTNLNLPLSGGKQTMFRMHRDIRFSKDKRPYKEHVSGLLTPTGTKHDDGGLLYAHLDAEGGFLAAGFYQLETRRLNLMRDAILADADRFSKIAKKLANHGYVFMDDGNLKRMPQGYSSYDKHPLADFLKRKNLVVHCKQSTKDWLEGRVLGNIVAFAKKTNDLLVFGTEALSA